MERNYLDELKEVAKNNNLNINLDNITADKNLFEQGVDSFHKISSSFFNFENRNSRNRQTNATAK